MQFKYINELYNYVMDLNDKGIDSSKDLNMKVLFARLNLKSQINDFQA